MTIRQRICQAGINTLREYVCLGGGGITIITEVDSLKEEDSIILAEVSTTSSLREEITEQIVEVKDTESIQEITGESLDGIC